MRHTRAHYQLLEVEQKTGIPISNRFDQQKSDRVDVFPKADREFVQVWNSPRWTPGRQPVLTYFRTAGGRARSLPGTTALRSAEQSRWRNRQNKKEKRSAPTPKRKLGRSLFKLVNPPVD